METEVEIEADRNIGRRVSRYDLESCGGDQRVKIELNLMWSKSVAGSKTKAKIQNAKQKCTAKTSLAKQGFSGGGKRGSSGKD